MYACLSCGFVHKGESVRRRCDMHGGGNHYPSKGFHGFIDERKCPECGRVQLVKMIEDKK